MQRLWNAQHVLLFLLLFLFVVFFFLFFFGSEWWHGISILCLALVRVFILMDKTNSISPSALYFVHLPDFKCLPFVYIFYSSAHLLIEFALDTGINLEAMRFTPATKGDNLLPNELDAHTRVYSHLVGSMEPKVVNAAFQIVALRFPING